MSSESLYSSKSADYFANVREEVLAPIGSGPHRVLEIGCGDGSSGAYLKEFGRAAEVVGVEISPAAGRTAEGRIDRVLIGNVESMILDYPPGYFDYLVMADVLEHLVEPWEQLARLAMHVREGGLVIASIPNVRNWRVVGDLVLRGNWTYAESGLLDRTHLRFFTKDSMQELFTGAGLHDVSVQPLGRRRQALARWVPGALPELVASQYLVLGRKGATRAES